MRKYVDSEELKNRIRKDMEKDGSTIAKAMGEYFCAMIDEMPAADVMELEARKNDGISF